jgi:hypothetical protein
MSKARLLALTVGAALLLSPAVVLAEGQQDHARFRFGAGGEAGWMGLAVRPVEALGALGVYLRLGVQLNDRYGLHVTGAASTVLFLNYARVALVADFSPTRFISLGTGINVARTYRVYTGGNGGESERSTFVGAPLVLSFYPGGGRLLDGSRAGTGLTLTGVVGCAAMQPRVYTNGFGGGITLAIGYEMH